MWYTRIWWVPVCETQLSHADTSIGAPECYRFDQFMESSPIHIGQTVDSWSLGCVFSEVATWVVHGREGLEAYRQMRDNETNQLDNFRDGRAFHDGENVLQCVGKMHHKVLQNMRLSDHVTGPVVKHMISEMLVEVDGRPSAKQLWSKSHRILKAADAELKSTEREPTEHDEQPESKVPPVTPPDLPPSLSERNCRRKVPRQRSLVKQPFLPRSATYNVLAPEHFSSPHSQEYESPEEIDSTGPTPLTSPQDTQSDSNNHHQRLSSHYDIHRSPSRIEQSQVADSPTLQVKSRKRGSTRDSRQGSNNAENRSPFGAPLGLNIRQVKEASSTQPPMENHFTPQTHSDQWQSQPAQKAHTMTSPLPPAEPHVRRELPYISLAEAENWMLNKQYHGKSYPSLEHKELLDELSRRDHVRHIPAILWIMLF